MRTDYDCAECRHRFAITVSGEEARTALDPDRTDACPKCAAPVGRGTVRCRRCDRVFALAMPHWHVRCNLAVGPCPACGTRYISACIC